MPDQFVITIPLDVTNADELGQFVAGLFVAQLANEYRFLSDAAQRVLDQRGQTLTEEQEKTMHAGMTEQAFDKAIRYFPEQLRTKITAHKSEFVASALNMN